MYECTATIAEKFFRSKAFLHRGADVAVLTSHGPGGSFNRPHRGRARRPDSTGRFIFPRAQEEAMIEKTAKIPLQLEIFSDYI
jgi:hypothetical protein